MANEDYISRRAISEYVTSHIQEINAGYGDLNYNTNRILRMIVDYIGKMPSVQPEAEEEQEVCRDCISRKEALEALNLCDFARCNDFANGATMLFEEDAKKRISELPSVRSAIEGTLEICEDCIDREKTLERFCELERVCDYIGSDMSMDAYCDALYDIVAKMPSVQPKVGRWIDGHCSECGCDIPAYIIDWKWQKDMNAKYCPNCGCRMQNGK